MFRGVEMRYTSKSASMVSLVQKRVTNLSENDTRVCICTAEYIISNPEYS